MITENATAICNLATIGPGASSFKLTGHIAPRSHSISQQCQPPSLRGGYLNATQGLQDMIFSLAGPRCRVSDQVFAFRFPTVWNRTAPDTRHIGRRHLPSWCITREHLIHADLSPLRCVGMHVTPGVLNRVFHLLYTQLQRRI